MKNLISRYKNGPVTVTIYNDGTKIREWDDEKYGIEPELEFPESCDIKITNFCEGSFLNNDGLYTICPFCHEGSSPSGKHGNLEKLSDMIERSNLPEGIEFAIGGGNPLTAPGIEKFLETEKSRNHIINVTMNYNHISPNGKYRQQTIDYLKRGLIKGLGVSVMDYNLENFLNDKELQDVSSNIVIHIIEGINSFYNVKEKLFNCKWKHPKVLILGKKNFGRYGMLSEDKKAIDDKQTAIWRENILNFLKEFNGVTSFDNLALERLDVLGKLPKEIVDTQYMGKDGVSGNGYLDIVNWQYGISSTAVNRYDIENKTFREIYKHLYQLTKSK